MDKPLPICYYQDAVRVICNEVEALVKKFGKPKMFDAIKLPPPELYKHVEVCFYTFPGVVCVCVCIH